MSSIRALSNFFWVRKERKFVAREILVFRFLRTESSVYDGNFPVQKGEKHFVWNRKTFFQASRVDFFINQMSSNNQRKNTLSHYPAKSPSPRPTASYILEKFNKKQSTCTVLSVIIA
jgi:hypothetical protein